MIEICCGSYEDALSAYKGGAKRIELNSALYLGGLTPTEASLKLTKRETDLTVICMVRPRGAGFCYTSYEFKQMMAEAENLLENGADGIASGFLLESHGIDVERTKEMVALIKSYQKEAVFHRAFDCVVDPYKSMEQLIDLDIDRVLTSGLKPKAIDGKELIRDLHKYYGERIEILAGSGINAENARELVRYTGISQIHSSCKAWMTDLTTSNEHVSYSYACGAEGEDYDIVSKEKVAELVKLEI